MRPFLPRGPCVAAGGSKIVAARRSANSVLDELANARRIPQAAEVEGSALGPGGVDRERADAEQAVEDALPQGDVLYPAQPRGLLGHGQEAVADEDPAVGDGVFPKDRLDQSPAHRYDDGDQEDRGADAFPADPQRGGQEQDGDDGAGSEERHPRAPRGSSRPDHALFGFHEATLPRAVTLRGSGNRSPRGR